MRIQGTITALMLYILVISKGLKILPGGTQKVVSLRLLVKLPVFYFQCYLKDNFETSLMIFRVFKDFKDYSK